MSQCPCGAEKVKGSAYCRPCKNARQNAYRSEQAIKRIAAKPKKQAKREYMAEYRKRKGSYITPPRIKESRLPPFNVFEVANNPIYRKWGNA